MFYCFLAQGFEETEALAPVDILRRAGIGVTTVGVGGKVIIGSHKIPVTADITIDEFVCGSDMEGVILPGGMPGVKNLYASQGVLDAVNFANDNGLYVCAICAAPMILGRLGIVDGKKATCFPGFEDELKGAEVTGEKVVVDGKVITSKGAGCALDFGLAITAQALDEQTAERVASSMQCR
ncbi:MAG: DJ-1/PfpI family protein [Ruminococcus sp.]|uniref:DJ-1 family glyoxalase III n=1 Tax=Ruminococcus sp. TaxID=41978 RepID=UPI002873F29C|nr:DJ-1 family glyoxalase III [Ruminococcus sp.]MBQ3286010.1 DJ-1/PfpI family protein [Ruminococcus sp.]